MDNKVMFYVINEEGIREDAQILAKYKLSNMNNYITYTYGEINDNNMIKIYTTGIVMDGLNYSYKEITSDDEWNQIKEVMKTIARDPSEPIPEEFKSELKISGEEVSVRKPKKLLVSKKFADTLASKYEEAEVTEPELAMPVQAPVEEKVEEPAAVTMPEEDLLNRTIEIPTFEELQARNKNIENVMKSTKVEQPKVEEPVATEEVDVPNLGSFEKVELPKEEEIKAPEMGPGYKEQFKKEVEPLLMSVYEKQMRHIEELEEELSKTKFDLFEKQKEALSLKKEKEEMQEEVEAVNQKMNGIISVIQGNNKD